MLGRGLAVAAFAAALDQAGKEAGLEFFGGAGCGNHRLPVTWFLDLVLTCNSGVSFGLFNQTGLNALIFSVLAALVVVVLAVWLPRLDLIFLAAAIGLIIGGAIGYVVARLRFGAVVYFFYFHAGL